MTDKDSAGRRKGKKVFEVAAAFLDKGEDQIIAWYEAGELSRNVLRQAIKSMSKANGDKLQAVYAKLALHRVRDLNSERTIVADRNNDKGPCFIRFAVGAERALYSITPLAEEDGFKVVRLSTTPPPKRPRAAKPEAAATTASA